MSDSEQPAREEKPDGIAPIASVGVVLAIAGFALLAVEVIRTLTGGVLGTFGTVLLWVGVGALAVGLLLLVLSLASDGGEVVTGEAEPTGAEPTVVEPMTPAVVPAPVEAAPPPPPPPPPPPAPPAPPPMPATAPVEAMPPVVPPESAGEPPSADGS